MNKCYYLKGILFLFFLFLCLKLNAGVVIDGINYSGGENESSYLERNISEKLGLDWRKNGTCSTITSDKKTLIHVKIRSRFSDKYQDNMIVNGIYTKAFENCMNLESVRLPNTMNYFLGSVFYGCEKLKSINLPNSLIYISPNAFVSCRSLDNIQIPNSVFYLGKNAFMGCSSLKNLRLGNGLTEISAEVFMGCSSLEKIEIPDGIVKMGARSFASCTKLKSVSLSRTLRIIDEETFDGCNIMSITIPSQVDTIGNYAFHLCPLKEIYVDASVPPIIQASTFSDYTATLYVPKESIEEYKNAPYWKNFFIKENIQLSKKYHTGYYSQRNDLDYYDIKGVTADGKAAIRIQTDYNEDNVHSYQIKLTYNEKSEVKYTGKYDELERDEEGYYYFIYTAPDDYPKEIDTNEYELEIKLSLKDKNTQEIARGETTIAVIRPPLLLTHGLNSNRTCFYGFNEKLNSTNMYADFQVLRTDYSETNNDFFTTNLYVVKNHLDDLFMQCLQQGYVSAKADLIGHSMGGILSRLHTQYVSKDEVNRIITLNTPHSGSQGANILMHLPLIDGKSLWEILNKRDIAVSDLQIDNDAIDNFLNHPTMIQRAEGIPVHAVCTNADISFNLERDILEDKKVLFSLLKLYCLMNPEFSIKKQGFMFVLNDFIKELYGGESDLVVSYESQKGGLSGNHVSTLYGDFSQAFHCNSPQNDNVHLVLISLLRKPKTDVVFAKGFTPKKIEFDLLNKTRSKRLQNEGDSYINVNADAKLDDAGNKSINVSFNSSGDIDIEVAFGFFNKDEMFVEYGEDIVVDVPDKYEGELKIYAIARTNKNEYVMDSTTVYFDNNHLKPVYIYTEDNNTIYMQVGQTIMPEILCGWDDNTESLIIPEYSSESDKISIDGKFITAEKTGECTVNARFDELDTSIPIVVIDSTRFYNTHLREIFEDKPHTVHAFYNSSSNKLTVEFLTDYSGALDIAVYNASGMVIYHQNETAREIKGAKREYDITVASKGVHIIRIQTANHTFGYKVLF